MDRLFPTWVRVGDFDGDGGERLFYHGFDGGAGAVPVFIGIRGWTGTAKERLWSYAPPFPVLTHKGHRYRYDVATPSLENLAAAGVPDLEVHLVRGEALPSDADCCPSQLLTRNYRFDSGMKPVGALPDGVAAHVADDHALVRSCAATRSMNPTSAGQ